MAASETTPRRWSTTDLLGPTALFVGAFLLAVTVALPTLLADGLRKVPLSTDFTTVAVLTEPATVLDRCSLNTPSARTVEADLVRQQRVVAVQPSDRDRVTLQAGTSIQADALIIDGKRVDVDAPRPGAPARTPDDPNRPETAPTPESDCTDSTITAVKDRITLDRTTAEPDLGDGGSSEIQYESRSAPVAVPDRRGFTYLFPFDLSTGDHTFFDTTTRRSVALRYTGDTQVEGHDVARFVAEITDTDLAGLAGASTPARPTTITRPASWFGVGGSPARPLTATLHHRSRWELAVDTRSGMIVDQDIVVDESYRLPAGTAAVADDFALPYLRARFTFDDRTREEMTQRAADLARPALIWGRLVPIGTGIVGAVLVVVGLWFLDTARIPSRIRRWAEQGHQD
ncbi:DUF3068 domain-containing protein [Gordonia sp. ABSL1-1]|uniref:DUF3068 domain-containing protein n=1 Tax=Gordonia sp. ABSL1-1 TaxID=3053923 RepID=UPI0025725855|nr:DUF3068 domain-containing protein [Gordonia sp. ABSL1-1]MDL9935144.1 DUF3068 domain-containing protein [Gordonia sp. ABSL1-1]